MKKVLMTLSGSRGVGKTSTLNLVISSIEKEYGVIAKCLKRDSHDKIAKIYNVGNNKRNIAINTAGDNSDCANKSVELLDEFDIVICATRSMVHGDSGSITTIKKYYKENKDKIILIPLFKLIQKDDDKKLRNENDTIIANIIMNQLKLYL